MKLTAPDAAFLHLCSLLASDPRRLEADPDLRREISAIRQAGLSCLDPLMSQVRWSFFEMLKAGGFTEVGGCTPPQPPTDGGVAFWNAWQDFAREVDAANRARSRAIMALHFERAAS